MEFLARFPPAVRQKAYRLTKCKISNNVEILTIFAFTQVMDLYTDFTGNKSVPSVVFFRDFRCKAFSFV